jgi:hypothetical protein
MYLRLRDVRLAPKAEIAPEGASSQTPEVFRHRPDRAEPTAEALPEGPRHSEKGEEQKHARGVEMGWRAGGHPHPEIHERSDGQPALDAGRARGYGRPASCFVKTDEAVKVGGDPDIERQEGQLEGPAEQLGAIAGSAAEELFAGNFGRRKRLPHLGGRQDRLPHNPILFSAFDRHHPIQILLLQIRQLCDSGH